MEAIRVYQIFAPESRPLHILALDNTVEEEADEQKTDQPNLAPAILKYLTKARNKSQLMSAALKMDARVSNSTSQVMRGEMRSGGNRSGAGNWSQKTDDAPPGYCSTCKTTNHPPGKMFYCLELINLSLNGGIISGGQCNACLIDPPNRQCKEKTCATDRFKPGQPAFFFCTACDTHKNIGECRPCQKWAAVSKIKIAEKIAEKQEAEKQEVGVKAATINPFSSNDYCPSCSDYWSNSDSGM